MRTRPWYAYPALWAALPCLGGMAYCHVRDIDAKLEEHVYYMAALFAANIAASIGLIVAIIVAYRAGSATWVRRTWIAAGALAGLTIACFFYSRVVGFPEMADHVGEWDALGVSSVLFESAIVVVAGSVLMGGRRSGALAGTAAVLLLLALGASSQPTRAETGMGDMHMRHAYADFSHASRHERRAVTRLWRSAMRHSGRYRKTTAARRAGYRTWQFEVAKPLPHLLHYRYHGSAALAPQLPRLSPTKPDAMMYWVDTDGHKVLVGYMYRWPRTAMHHPFLHVPWHRHSTGSTIMFHLWFTKTLESAYAGCFPVRALQASLGHRFHWSPSPAPDISADQPCRHEPERGMPEQGEHDHGM